MLIERIGPATTFWIYGAMCVAAIVFAWRYVPETKGRSLEEIENTWNAQ
jgi:SP family arabinose:H+ symporter-like MFS transporter